MSGTVQVSANASDNVGVVGVQFYVDGSPLGAEDTSAPYSISWDTTATADGSHTLTAVARDAANNRNTSAPVSVAVSNTRPTSQRSPFKGVPSAVPGLFEAEDFDKGGEGVAYHDLTPGNQGGAYRTSEDVDITSLLQGYVVTSFATGEWLEYTISVSQSGTYRLEALVSSAVSTSRFHIEIDRVNVTGLIAVPNTGSLANYQWVGNSGINLSVGQHILRVFADQQLFNIDAIRSSIEVSKIRGRTVH